MTYQICKYVFKCQIFKYQGCQIFGKIITCFRSKIFPHNFYKRIHDTSTQTSKTCFFRPKQYIASSFYLALRRCMNKIDNKSYLLYKIQTFEILHATFFQRWCAKQWQIQYFRNDLKKHALIVFSTEKREY